MSPQWCHTQDFKPIRMKIGFSASTHLSTLLQPINWRWVIPGNLPFIFEWHDKRCSQANNGKITNSRPAWNQYAILCKHDRPWRRRMPGAIPLDIWYLKIRQQSPRRKAQDHTNHLFTPGCSQQHTCGDKRPRTHNRHDYETQGFRRGDRQIVRFCLKQKNARHTTTQSWLNNCIFHNWAWIMPCSTIIAKVSTGPGEWGKRNVHHAAAMLEFKFWQHHPWCFK